MSYMNPKFYAFVTAAAALNTVFQFAMGDHIVGAISALIASCAGIACAVAMINVQSIYGEDE